MTQKLPLSVAGRFIVAVLAAGGLAACGGGDDEEATAAPPCEIESFAAQYVSAAKKGATLENGACYAAMIGSLEDARAARGAVIALWAEESDPVGYKIAGADAGTRARLGIAKPVVGVLFTKMIKADGFPVTTPEGGSALIEADMLIRIRSEAINDARTVEDVAREISAIYPFLESPFIGLPEGTPVTEAYLTAANGGARLGFMGGAMSFRGDEKTVRDIRWMKVVLRNGGEVLHQGDAGSPSRHPFEAVLLLLEDLRESGQRLQADDFVSLGALSPLFPVTAGDRIDVSYQMPDGQIMGVGAVVQ